MPRDRAARASAAPPPSQDRQGNQVSDTDVVAPAGGSGNPMNANIAGPERAFAGLRGGQCMNRREFIGLLGGAAVAWPVAAHAQQAVGLRRIGVLMASAEDNPQYQAYVGVFREAFQKLGW